MTADGNRETTCRLGWCVREEDEADLHLGAVDGFVLLLEQNTALTTQLERCASYVEAVVRVDFDLADNHGHSIRLLASEAVVLADRLTRAAEAVLGDPPYLEPDAPVVAFPAVKRLPGPRLSPEGDGAA